MKVLRYMKWDGDLARVVETEDGSLKGEIWVNGAWGGRPSVPELDWEGFPLSQEEAAEMVPAAVDSKL